MELRLSVGHCSAQIIPFFNECPDVPTGIVWCQKLSVGVGDVSNVLSL